MTAAVLQVLVLEDDLIWRTIMRAALSKIGIVPTEARTIDEAGEALAVRPFDIVLLDYQLASGNGLDLLERCDRSRLGNVVLVTGYANREELADPRADQIDAYLTKPFSSVSLLACLEALGRTI